MKFLIKSKYITSIQKVRPLNFDENSDKIKRLYFTSKRKAIAFEF